jgi:fructose-bisphosphate aldolase class II
MIKNPCFAYNIWNIELCEIFTKLSKKYSTPVILQVSEKIALKMDLDIFTKQINILKETAPEHIFLNLDHAISIKLVKECIDLGWDMITYDGSSLSLEENIKNAKEIVKYAHEQNTLIEGEIDPIYSYKTTKKSVNTHKTDIETAKKFIKSTDVDYFAIAVGTLHGYSPDGLIEIDYDLLDKASKELGVNLVLHGGSGLSIDTYNKCFLLNIKKINISTEIKRLYKQAILNTIYKKEFDIRFLNQHVLKEIERLFIEKNKSFEGIT